MPAKIFFCYAHEDEALLNKLKTHLRPLQRQNLIDIWYDRNISAGSVWEEDIKKHLNEADIILLLISPSFMASEYIHDIELKRAIERHKEGNVRVIPIILEYTDWQYDKQLNILQALPIDAIPVNSSHWHNQNEAFYNVVTGIRKAVNEIQQKHSDASLEVAEQPIIPSASLPPDRQEITHQASTELPSIEILPKVRSKFVLTEHTKGVSSVAISPDGQTIVSGSTDKTVRIWGI